MRIPGTQPITSKIIRWFELSERDVSVFRTGVRDLKATASGVVGGTIVDQGFPFDSWRGAIATLSVSTAQAMASRRRRNQVYNAEEQVSGVDDGTGT